MVSALLIIYYHAKNVDWDRNNSHIYFVIFYHFCWLAATPVWFRHSLSEIWIWFQSTAIWYLNLRFVCHSLLDIWYFDIWIQFTVIWYLNFEFDFSPQLSDIWLWDLFAKDYWIFDILIFGIQTTVISYLNLRFVTLDTNFIFAFEQQNKVTFLTNYLYNFIRDLYCYTSRFSIFDLFANFYNLDRIEIYLSYFFIID